MKTLKIYFLHIYLIAFVITYSSFTAKAQVPDLGAVAGFALFTGAGAVDNTGISFITGKIGTHAGAINNFPPVIGQQQNANALTLQASGDLNFLADSLFNADNILPLHAPVFGNGEVLNAGVYKVSSAASFNGVLTLDGQGNTDAVFIFQITGALSSAPLSTIILQGGLKAENIFWVAKGGAISITTPSDMKGNFIAFPGAVSMGDGAILDGRLLSTTGAISVYNSGVNSCSCIILASGLKNFRASQVDNRISLQWNAVNEISVSRYEIEKSVDGRFFGTIGEVKAYNLAATSIYQWLDLTPVQQINFYRLKIIQMDGGSRYSSTIRTGYQPREKLVIFPNPLKGHIINLQMASMPRDNYQVIIYNINGSKLVSTNMSHDGYTTVTQLQLKTTIAPGTYLLQMIDSKKLIQTRQIIIEK